MSGTFEGVGRGMGALPPLDLRSIHPRMYFWREEAAGSARDLLEVIGFRAGEVVIADDREPAAAPGLLAAGPAQARIEIIGTVHEDGARLDPIADGDGAVDVGGPEAGRQAEIAVVHQVDRFCVILDGHDADHRAEA